MATGSGPPMVGRDAELSTVNALVDRVRDGRGGVLLVLGEAGIGKSRLLAEAAVHARDAGLLVLTGRAVEGGGAYRPLAEALVRQLGEEHPVGADQLRPYRPALGRLLPGWADAGAALPDSVDPVLVLGEGLLRLLGMLNGGRGCLLALEDLHWADADTFAVIEYLAGALHATPVAVVGTIRDDESPPCPRNRLLERPEVRSVRLRRLMEADVLALAERCAGDVPLPDVARRLAVDRSDGLPFMVEELVAGVLERDGALDRGPGRGPDPDPGPDPGRGPNPGQGPTPMPVPVPPTLAGLVAARLAPLAPECRRVLEAAAVIGGEPDSEVLGPVTGLPEEAVLGAIRAGQPRLFVPAGDTLRWRHALTRDAVLDTVPPPERASIARRAATVLLRRGEPDDEVRAAELLGTAGARDHAAEIFLRLARRNLARGALRDARAMLARADETTALRSAVAIERVRLLTLLGEAEAALEAGTGALAEAVGEDHARLCLRLADAALAQRRCAEAERYLERAGRPDDPHALVLAADAAFGQGDLLRAERLAEVAIERAEAAGADEVLCRALITLGLCASRRSLELGRATYSRAAQIAAERGLRPWRIRALISLSNVDHSLSRVVEDDRSALRELAEAHELAMAAGQLGEVLATDLMRAIRALTIDGPLAAEPTAREVAERAGRLRLVDVQALAEGLIGFARAADRDGAGLSAALDAATGHPHGPVEVTALASGARALWHLMDRDLPAADRLLDPGMRTLVDHGTAAPVPVWGLWALLRTVADPCDDKARTRVRGSVAVLLGLNKGVLRYADAIAAGHAGRPEQAAESLADGDRLLALHHWWRRLCRLPVLEAALNDGWGDPVPVLRTDLAVFERTSEVRLARICRDLLRRAGAPTRRGRGHMPVPAGLRAEGVTSREMDVLGLVADGLTNRQIAERLFLSRRTVDTHVANLLAKTGAAGRAELRGLILDQDRLARRS